MNRLPMSSAAALVVLASAHSVLAATLTVGPGKSYATPCAAVAAAAAGDTILISPGTSSYTDSCTLGTAGITLRGVGGRPVIDLSGTVPLPNEKGIYDVTADGITLDNLEIMGASVGDSAAGLGANGAGIRDEASGLVVTGCYIHDNQDGILATPGTAGSTLTVEYTELAHNALGDGCGGPGCTHNIYVGSNNMETLVFAFNWSHDAGDGNAAGNGHLVKTRAQNSYILYNALLGETGTESYELDVPQGGFTVVVGNVLEKSATAENPNVLSYAEEGLSNTSSDLFVASNTFVSDYPSAVTFIKVASGTLAAHDNLFSGNGTMSSTGALSADNLAPAMPMFVAPSTYNYHLAAGSPAIGKGVAAGDADGFSLTPVYEYVQPTESTVRAVGAALDVGAFQYGTDIADAGESITVSVADGGVATSDDGGSPVEAGASTSSGASSAGSASGSAASGSVAPSGSSSTVASQGSSPSSHASSGKSSASASHAGDGGANMEGEAGTAPGSSSGCGCTVVGRREPSPGLFAVLGLAVVGLVRRRRASL